MDGKSSIDLDTDPRSIIGSRLFDAPRELVFSAFTDPEHLAQWWGPNGFTTTMRIFEFRPGGVWRFVMHGPDGRDYQNRITYEEIVRPERIVYRHDGGEDVEPVQFSQTLTFEDLGSTHAAYLARTIPVSGSACAGDQSLRRRQRPVADYGAARRLRRHAGNSRKSHNVLAITTSARSASRRSARTPGPELLDLRMCVFPDRIGPGQQRTPGRRQSKTSAAAVFLVDRNFQKAAPFERLEIGRERRSVHGEKGRDAAELGGSGRLSDISREN